MAAGSQIISVLDVLDNALGEDARSAALEKLTLTQLDNVAEVLDEFWNAQPDVDGETDRQDRASFVGGWMGPFWSEQMLRQDLSGALLYYPKILVLDPLADFFSHGEGLPTPWTVGYVRPDRQINTVSSGPAMWRQQGTFDSMRFEPIAAAGRFAHIVRNLYSLEKPIRAGVIVVRSQWPTLKANAPRLATAVRHHVRSAALQDFLEAADMSELQVWDNLAGGQLTMSLPVVGKDAPMRAAPVFYYLAKTLAIAQAGGAQYVPVNASSLGLLKSAYNESVRTHPEAMLREVTRIVVPSADIPIAEAVSMRVSSDDFEDWRLALRSLHRASEGDDVQALRERAEETLVPRVHQVERALSRSSVGESFRRGGGNFVVDGAVGVATGMASAAGGGVATAALVGLAGAAGGGMLRWLLGQYAPQPIDGAQAVLTTLVRAARKP